MQLYIVRDGERRGAARPDDGPRRGVPARPDDDRRAPLRAGVAGLDLARRPDGARRAADAPRHAGRREPREGHAAPLARSLSAFPRWKDWSFFDPLTAKQSFDETLAELTTERRRRGRVPARASSASSAPRTACASSPRASRRKGNRSVANEAAALVSPLPYLVAWKADGDLGFVKRGTPAPRRRRRGGTRPRAGRDEGRHGRADRDHVRERARPPGERAPLVSVGQEGDVARQDSRWRSARRRRAITVPTDAPGTLRLRAARRRRHGAEPHRRSRSSATATSRARVERNAELKVSLAKTDYAAGDEIEVAIVAPYAGAGLDHDRARQGLRRDVVQERPATRRSSASACPRRSKATATSS